MIFTPTSQLSKIIMFFHIKNLKENGAEIINFLSFMVLFFFEPEIINLSSFVVFIFFEHEMGNFLTLMDLFLS